MSGEDIKKFIFPDAIIKEQALKEFFDSFGMKYENSIKFEEFADMIKNNIEGDNEEEKEKEDDKGNNKKYILQI